MICKWLGDRLVPGNLPPEVPSLTITRQPQSRAELQDGDGCG